MTSSSHHSAFLQPGELHINQNMRNTSLEYCPYVPRVRWISNICLNRIHIEAPFSLYCHMHRGFPSPVPCHFVGMRFSKIFLKPFERSCDPRFFGTTINRIDITSVQPQAIHAVEYRESVLEAVQQPNHQIQKKGTVRDFHRLFDPVGLDVVVKGIV